MLSRRHGDTAKREMLQFSCCECHEEIENRTPIDRSLALCAVLPRRCESSRLWNSGSGLRKPALRSASPTRNVLPSTAREQP
jgi:hypothetical protein